MSLSLSQLESLLAQRLGSTIEQATTHLEAIRACDIRTAERREQASKEAMEYSQRTVNNKKSRLYCNQCQNSDERLFENFEHEGQITCQVCGTIVMQGQLHDGAWVRKFEGDDGDVGFQGAPPDIRFSQEKNLATGMMAADKARGGGGKTASKELALLQQQVEMDSSNYGDKHSKKTRQGYKDDMKREVFEEMEEAANALQIHEWVVTRAQTLFGQLRDEVDNLRDKPGVAAGCMIFALREATSKDHQGIKRKNDKDEDDSINRFKCPNCGIGFGDKKSWRYHIKECRKESMQASSSQSNNDVKSTKMS
jgi:hypothetical protein